MPKPLDYDRLKQFEAGAAGEARSEPIADSAGPSA